MKKYGYLVTFVGQKYFNLSLPASCLSLTHVHLYQLPDHIKAAVSEESNNQRRGPPAVPRSPFRLQPRHCYQLQSLIRTRPFFRHVNGGEMYITAFLKAAFTFFSLLGRRKLRDKLKSHRDKSWKAQHWLDRLQDAVRSHESSLLELVNCAKYTAEYN